MSKRNKKNNRHYKRNHKKRSNINYSNYKNNEYIEEMEEVNKNDIDTIPNIFWEHFYELVENLFFQLYSCYNKEPFDIYFEEYEKLKLEEDFNEIDLMLILLEIIFRDCIFFDENKIKEELNIDINEYYKVIFSEFVDKYIEEFLYNYYQECMSKLVTLEFIDFSTPYMCCIPLIKYSKEYFEKLIKEDLI